MKRDSVINESKERTDREQKDTFEPEKQNDGIFVDATVMAATAHRSCEGLSDRDVLVLFKLYYRRGMIQLNRKSKMTVLLSVLLSLLILLSFSGCNGSLEQGESPTDERNFGSPDLAKMDPEQAAEYDEYHEIICDIFSYSRSLIVDSDSSIGTRYQIFPSPETEDLLALFDLTQEDVDEMLHDLDRMKTFATFFSVLKEEFVNKVNEDTTLLGKYYFKSLTDENGEVVVATSLFEDFDEEQVYMEFLSDNVADLVIGGDSTGEMFFVQYGNTVYYFDPNGDEYTGIVDGNTVTMDNGFLTMHFEKK